MLLEGLRFVKTLATFGRTLSSFSPVDSPSIFLTILPEDDGEFSAPIFPNQGGFPTCERISR